MGGPGLAVVDDLLDLEGGGASSPLDRVSNSKIGREGHQHDKGRKTCGPPIVRVPGCVTGDRGHGRPPRVACARALLLGAGQTRRRNLPTGPKGYAVGVHMPSCDARDRVFYEKFALPSVARRIAARHDIRYGSKRSSLRNSRRPARLSCLVGDRWRVEPLPWPLAASQRRRRPGRPESGGCQAADAPRRRRTRYAGRPAIAVNHRGQPSRQRGEARSRDRQRSFPEIRRPACAGRSASQAIEAAVQPRQRVRRLGERLSPRTRSITRAAQR